MSGPSTRTAIFQLSVSAGLVIASGMVACSARAGTSTIGRTWPIAEPDALSEIEGRTARQPASIASSFGPRSRWSAMHAASLSRTARDQVRSVVPFYTLSEEIRLPDGKVLYPAGFSFNPLSFVALPQRLVIVAPRDLAWALQTATPTDFILLTAGGRQDDDAITAGERHARPILILEERVKERLGLTVAPVIVRQVGQKLELREIRVDPTSALPTSVRRARP